MRGGQCDREPINPMLTMKIKPALTMKFYRSLNINVRSSFVFLGESATQTA
jgi:hypothetical protein